MKFPNPFKINSWRFKDFLIFILLIQFLLLFSIYIENIDYRFQFLEIIIGFIYLTFIPGIILLRILNIHGSTTIENILLSIGLSILIIMVFGLFLNILCPLIGIIQPISIYSLSISFTILVLILLGVCFITNQDNKNANNIEYFYLDDLTSPSALLLLLLPFLSILGVVLVNDNDNNQLLLIVILIIATIPFLISINKGMPKKIIHWQFLLLRYLSYIRVLY